MTTKVGPGIREQCSKAKFPGVSVVCQSDNAGGHGTNAEREGLTKSFKNDFDIEILWQPSNSPDTNAQSLTQRAEADRLLCLVRLSKQQAEA